MTLPTGWGNQLWGLDRWGGGVFQTGPFVRDVSPTVGTTIDDTMPVYFEVSAAALPMTLVISAQFDRLAILELVYAGTLTPYYNNASSYATAIADGLKFQLIRTPKWPDGNFTIKVNAIDLTGRAIAQSLSWFVEEAIASTVVTTKQDFTKIPTDPLGNGLIRPFRRVSTNDFATASGADLVRAAVGQILGTARGEVPWRPRLGTLLSKLRHMRNVQALPELARVSIEEALRQWEPRIAVSELTAERATGENANKVILSLKYRIGSANPDIIRLLV